MTNVYNPFSLLNALAKQEFSNFWANSGASSLLPKFVPNLDVEINSYNDHFRIDRDTLETSDITSTEYGLFLYQSGYLTIQSSDEYTYSLGFPSAEVRDALYKIVLTGVGRYAYRRDDDVYVVPIGCLKN